MTNPVVSPAPIRESVQVGIKQIAGILYVSKRNSMSLLFYFSHGSNYSANKIEDLKAFPLLIKCLKNYSISDIEKLPFITFLINELSIFNKK